MLLNTKRLTVKMLPFNGFFTLPEKNKIDTVAKLIGTLSGGPVFSLVLVIVLLYKVPGQQRPAFHRGFSRKST